MIFSPKEKGQGIVEYILIIILIIIVIVVIVSLLKPNISDALEKFNALIKATEAP